MQHIRVPISEVMYLIVNPEIARISKDSTHMMSVIDNELHILVGDFTGIDSDKSLEDVIKQNFE